MRTERNLAIGCFCVDGSSVFVADEVLPIVAEIDQTSGEVRRVVTWDVDSVDSEQPTATALAVHDGSLWISAPSAGGMIRVILDTSESAVVPLDFAPGPITTLGSDLVVVAYREWRSIDEAAPNAVPDHPVVWSGSEQDPPFDPSEIDMSFDIARPVWRIGRHGVEQVDLGGDVASIVSLDREHIFATVRRSDHAVVLTPEDFGGVSFSYPASVVRFDSDFRGEVVAELHDHGTLFVTDSEVWCSDHGGRGHRQPGLLRVHPPGQPSDLVEGAISPDAVTGTEAIVVENARFLTDDATPTPIARVVSLLDGSEVDTIELPARVDHYGDYEPVVDGPDIWFVTDSGDALVRIDLLSRKAELLPVVVPTAAHRPSPVAPPGVDLHEHNIRSLETMRAELLGGWRGDDGTRHPFISGVEFESIELAGGDFPDASIVATFRSVHRPGAIFGIRWYLYDELGRPEDPEYWGIHLMEEVETGGLPTADSGRPDEHGVLWIE